MNFRTASWVLLSILVLASPAAAAGVRVQLQEVVFQIDRDGNSHPIDHQVVDVFPLDFENQYGAVDRTSENGDYGASYIEVPASAGAPLNHDIYVYIKDGPLGAITDGYHNRNVPGALFKITAMTLRRIDDKVRVRVMHVIDPPAGGGEGEAAAPLRDLQHKVDAYLRAGGGATSP